MNEATIHILLVEDEAAHTELIRRAFAPQQERVHLTVARSLREARAHLATSTPDLVLVDWLLPDGQGTALVPGAGAIWHYPVMVMTSYGNEQVAVEAMKAGAVDYVVKSEATLADLPHIAERALHAWQHILERKRAEEALQQSEERYRELFENANDIIYTHDLAGNFTSLNRAAERLTGYRRDEALHMNVADLVVPEHLERSRQMIAAKLTGTRTPAYELDIRTKAGQRLTLEVSTQLICEAGQPIAVQGIARDVTERRKLEAQLRQSQRMEAIGTLAGGIAHDFNNILGVILGYTELTFAHVSPESVAADNLRQMLIAGERAKALVHQILTFSRQTEQTHMPMPLDLVVREALTLLRASLPSTIEIRQAIAQDAGMILGDPSQMHQVLMNLCANAEHAMRQTGGVLEIRLEAVEVGTQYPVPHPTLRPGPYVRLTVRDTGHGMRPEVMERIFEPFFTTKVKEEGTGMGLAMVHGIISGHHGIITVASTVGQGTTFTIYLPRVDGNVSEEAPLEPAPAVGKGRILFVDDEEPLVRLGQLRLTHLGYDVVAHTSSPAALETFRATPQCFDLVITDQTMPQMTGEILARAVRAIRPDVPIILCTGFSHVINADQARALGINMFLMKPLVLRDLARAIQQVLTP